MNISKLIYIAFLISLPTLFAYSQDKKISISTDDTTHYKSRYGTGNTRLPYMTIKPEDKAWRFWYDKYIAASFIIDVTGRDSSNCEAFITTYTYGDLKWNDKDKFSKVYYRRAPLPKTIATRLYQAAKIVNISRFATSDTLGNLVSRYMCTDCSPYTVEYFSENTLYFKTGLRSENISQFNSFVNTATELINFEELKVEFEKEVPFGYYSSNKWMIINHKLTSKQIKRFNQYWQRKAN